MKNGSLKHYKTYLKRLKLFAKAMNIKVIFTEDMYEEGIWMPSVRRIKIKMGMTNQVTIAALLHELGHSVDDLLSLPSSEGNKLHKAYTALYKDRSTTKQRKLVVECESRAWHNGIDVAERLNIRLGKWYYDFKEACLHNYKYN